MRCHPPFLRTTVAILIAAFFSNCGGSRYTPTEFNADRAREYKVIQLKHRNQAIDVSYRSLVGDTLRCRRFIKATSSGQRYLAQAEQVSGEDKLYLMLNPATDVDWNQDYLHIPVDAILSAEVRKKDHTLAVIGVVGVVALAAIIIAAANTKSEPKPASSSSSSCPYLYAFDGTEYALEGELYSGAILPLLERDDYLRLHAIQPCDNLYRMRMANELHEVQYTNLTELLVCDHPRNTELLVDKHGMLHTIAAPLAPRRATTQYGDTVLHRISHAEGYSYDGGIDQRSDAVDTLTLTFPLHAPADSGKLIVRARNTLWLEFALAEFSDAFGGMYDEFFDRYSTSTSEDLHQWTQDQSIPLDVSVRRDGEWIPVDAFNLAGPLAFRDDVMMIPLPRAASEVEVRLAWGHSFWEIDYVALDVSRDAPVSLSVVPLRSAVDQDGGDLRASLVSGDSLYHVMSRIGESAELTFEAPPMVPGSARSVVLHSRGHYHRLHKSSGPPDLPRLFSFRRPGSFPNMARELFVRGIKHLQASH